MPCPDCGYMMTAFDKECPRCERIGIPQKPCLKCGGSSAVRDTVCQHCRHRFGDPVETPPSVSAPLISSAPLVSAEPAGPHYANISPVNHEELRQIVQEEGWEQNEPLVASCGKGSYRVVLLPAEGKSSPKTTY